MDALHAFPVQDACRSEHRAPFVPRPPSDPDIAVGVAAQFAIRILALISMATMTSRPYLPVLVLFLAACGDKGKGAAAGDAGVFDAGPVATPFIATHSCDWRAAAGTCTDFANRADLELHKKMCDSFKGSFAETPCPKEKQVGSCEVEKDERKRYYDGAVPLTFTAQTAKENCESPHLKGKFTAP